MCITGSGISNHCQCAYLRNPISVVKESSVHGTGQITLISQRTTLRTVSLYTAMMKHDHAWVIYLHLGIASPIALYHSSNALRRGREPRESKSPAVPGGHVYYSVSHALMAHGRCVAALAPRGRDNLRISYSSRFPSPRSHR